MLVELASRSLLLYLVWDYQVLTVENIASNTAHINIPTLHLHGLLDSHLEIGRKMLRNYFINLETTGLIEINYHHAMLWAKDDLAELAKE